MDILAVFIHLGGTIVKRKIAVTIMVLFLSIITGCKIDLSRPYEFRQNIVEIHCIDILKQNDYYDSWDNRFSVISSLDKTVYSDFLCELVELEGQPFINPPSTSFDKYVIRIIYYDGEEEYISCNNNAYRIPNRELQYDTYWFSDKYSFYNLLSSYSGLEIN